MHAFFFSFFFFLAVAVLFSQDRTPGYSVLDGLSNRTFFFVNVVAFFFVLFCFMCTKIRKRHSFCAALDITSGMLHWKIVFCL